MLGVAEIEGRVSKDIFTEKEEEETKEMIVGEPTEVHEVTARDTLVGKLEMEGKVEKIEKMEEGEVERRREEDERVSLEKEWREGEVLGGEKYSLDLNSNLININLGKQEGCFYRSATFFFCMIHTFFQAKDGGMK